MFDSRPSESGHATNVPPQLATVTDLSTRRRSDDLLTSISFVFDGVHYGTFPISLPYSKGKPLVLYVVPAGESADRGAGVLSGSLECLITDDAELGFDNDHVLPSPLRSAPSWQH